MFREIFSYIKGSTAAMAAPKGFISREQYLALPQKLTAVPPEQRVLAYSHFEAYAKRARLEHTYDVCDLLLHLPAPPQPRTGNLKLTKSHGRGALGKYRHPEPLHARRLSAMLQMSS